MPSRANQIHIKQLQLSDEKHPIKRQKKVLELEILQLYQQIDNKRATIDQLDPKKED
jgi:hypothetical protein